MKLIALLLMFAYYADANAQVALDSDGAPWRYVQGSASQLDSDAVATSWKIDGLSGTYRAVVTGCQTGKGRMSIRLGDQTKDYIWHYKGVTLVDQVGFATCVKGVYK